MESPSSGGNAQVVVGVASLDLSPPPGPDGYKELAVALQMWGGITGYRGPRERLWYVLAAARRLDLAHRQFERVRETLDGLALSSSPDFERRFAVLGDAELATIALYRAALTAKYLHSRLGVTLKRRLPRSVDRHMTGLRELRSAYEHIEDRAVGRLDRKGTVDLTKAHRAFSLSGRELVETRTIRYRRWSLKVDAPATRLFLDLRGYLRAVWLELCHEDFQRRHAP